MKKVIVFLICVLSTGTLFAQESAITDSGEEVLLFPDGTWKYAQEKADKVTEIPTNAKKFVKSANSTFLLKSTKLNVGFWLDPKVWTFKKATNNEDAEYELSLKQGDLYGMVITEKVEIPLETLKSIAVQNGKSVAPDLHIVKEEYRIVNGVKVLWLQMNGTMQGIKFTYNGYYFSNAKGTVQFITYTSQALFNDFKAVSEELLNGFVELK